jgi:hypothetical protein
MGVAGAHSHIAGESVLPRGVGFAFAGPGRQGAGLRGRGAGRWTSRISRIAKDDRLGLPQSGASAPRRQRKLLTH